MQKIKIRNFGPVKDIELEIKDFLLFIGPQASGKSAVSKCIYFFKSLRDDFIRSIYDSLEKDEVEKPLESYIFLIRNKFKEFWGTAGYPDELFIQFFYSEDIHITIFSKKENKYINILFSPEFQDEFEKIVSDAQRFLKRKSQTNGSFLSSSEIIAFEAEKRAFSKRIEDFSNVLFNDSHDLLFIPAGRSLMAILAEQLKEVKTSKLDYLMRSFVNRINISKELFSKSMEELIEDKKYLTQDKIDFKAVNLAKDIIYSILKAKYNYDGISEKLLLHDGKYIRLDYASSGQQEAVWILLLTFLLILENKPAFVVFEEPEAHLYPEAQREMVNLLTLLANRPGNQVIITTHSPYILSSLNNLIFANKLAAKKEKAVIKKINRLLWVDINKISAFFIDNGKLNNIIDHELNLIQTEAVDSASRLINQDYEYLFELDE